jgi:hypothetical protein
MISDEIDDEVDDEIYSYKPGHGIAYKKLERVTISAGMR